jgi:hypothetical protein
MIWFHASCIITDAPICQRNLCQGQLVEYEPGIARSGKNFRGRTIAFNVRPLRPEEVLSACREDARPSDAPQ